MILFVQVRYYCIAVIDIFLLQVYFWDWVDHTVRTLSVFAGLVIAVLTALKLWQDLKNKVLEGNLKKLEIQKLKAEVEHLSKVKSVSDEEQVNQNNING